MLFHDVCGRHREARAASARCRDSLPSRLGARLFHSRSTFAGGAATVAIARALANNPPLVLADEPCASLDADTRREVLAGNSLTVCREGGRPLLIVSHDAAVLDAGDQVVDITRSITTHTA